MFAGHVGAALVIARAERRVNVGVFVFAALLLDVLLWIFVFAGWESVRIPADFASRHQAAFVFPYSHSLLAAAWWSAVAGAAIIVWWQPLDQARIRAGALVAAAVFSHWLLDALVHEPEMPLAGAGSAKVGLALWNDIPLALGVEALIVVAGAVLFVAGAGLSRARATGLIALCVLILVVTVAGMTVAPPPPSALAMAESSLAVIAVVSALASWLGRRPAPA
jgi:membrane-bound metal-dependent hydrolase YbcI (DUF457 family)